MATGRSFGAAVSAYDRARPGYAPEAIEWLLPGGPCQVADVGAGSGKLTDALVSAGHWVTVIEPDETMLAALTARHPRLRAYVGTAEHIPLPDASVDALTFGQAWHWVDPERASAEAARVLRPGGVLALVWNTRDTRVPWVAEFGDIVGASAAEQMIGTDAVHVAAPLNVVQRHSLVWVDRIDTPTLVDLAASRSHVIAKPASEQARILAAVRTLGESVAADDGGIDLPYRTHLFRSVLPR